MSFHRMKITLHLLLYPKWKHQAKHNFLADYKQLNLSNNGLEHLDYSKFFLFFPLLKELVVQYRLHITSFHTEKLHISLQMNLPFFFNNLFIFYFSRRERSLLSLHIPGLIPVIKTLITKEILA